MRYARNGLWLTLCAVVLCACASSGGVVSPAPKPQPVDKAAMEAPSYEQKVRAELFEPQPTPTPR